MKSNNSRRAFIKRTSCVACVSLASISGLKSWANVFDDDIPDPKKLEYCGYSCPDDCELRKATITNDLELKKACYEKWQMKERFGIEFDAEKVVCYTCKTDAEYKGQTVESCSVRKCAIEKRFDCCIECPDLKNCDKELWTRFPDFHKYNLQQQEKFKAAQA